MTIDLLFGANAFWSALKRDLLNAKQRICVQTMSFEGDWAGQALTDTLCQCTASDKHLALDRYSRFVINDRFRFTPKNWRDPVLQREWQSTLKCLDQLTDTGTRVTWTNPMGFCGLYYPARNHKKIIVIDDQLAYLGGINFTQHNFEWNDLMIRIADAEVNAFLGRDFQHSVHGAHQSRYARLGGNDFYLMNGRSSADLYARLFQNIDQAKTSIRVFSPYITFPAMTHLKAAAARGVAVTIYSPGQNNKAMFQHYIAHTTAGTGIQLRWLDQQNFHLKAMLIDGQTLILGSSNFDIVSYQLEQEVIAVIRDPDVIQAFQDQVLDYYGRNSKAAPDTARSVKGAVSEWMLWWAGLWCGWVKYFVQ